jgi:hypothetical protein
MDKIAVFSGADAQAECQRAAATFSGDVGSLHKGAECIPVENGQVLSSAPAMPSPMAATPPPEGKAAVVAPAPAPKAKAPKRKRPKAGPPEAKAPETAAAKAATKVEPAAAEPPKLERPTARPAGKGRPPIP